MFLCWEQEIYSNLLGENIYKFFIFMIFIFVFFSIYYYFFKKKFDSENIYVIFSICAFLFFLNIGTIILLGKMPFEEDEYLCGGPGIFYFRITGLIYYIFSVGLFYIMSILFSKKNNINKDKFDRFFKISLIIFIIIAIIIWFIYPNFAYESLV